jgi:hypothetical protein
MHTSGETLIDFVPTERYVSRSALDQAILRTITLRDHGPPLRNPTRPPIRERILALYRKQGRPAEHLARVERLGRHTDHPKSLGKRTYGTNFESRMDRYGWIDADPETGKWVSKGHHGVHRDWSSYL